MTGSDFVGQLREANKTELSRLGSSKSLYADTEGEMDPPVVLAVAADAAFHAAETFEQWADEADVAGTFSSAAETADGRHDRLIDSLDSHEAGASQAALSSLADLETVSERLGGLVGWTLVREQKATQYSGFFTGQADPQTAGLFREFGDEYESIREDAVAALDSIDPDEDDWMLAESTATNVIEAAYDEYFETLEEMGVNPKPVC